MRTKTATLDGASATIAALTMTQVRAFAEQYQSAKGSDGKFDLEKLAKAHSDIVLSSLNRAAQAIEWTKERLEEEWDSIFFTHVFKEVLAFSGVEIVEIRPLGEQKAAS